MIEGTPDAPVFKTVDGRVVGKLDGDADFQNAKAEKDQAEKMARWKKEEAEAAARAKESPPCGANGPPRSGVPPDSAMFPPGADPPRGDPPNTDPPDGPIEDLDIPF